MHILEQRIPSGVLILIAAALAIGAMVAAALLLGSGKGAQATHAEPPTEISGNTTCGAEGQLLGQSWTELKIQDTAPFFWDGLNGTFDDGTLSVTITGITTALEPPFNWSSNIGVDAVFVKGGSGGGFLYLYDPEVTADTGLTTPDTSSGEPAGISHISFCYDLPDATPTPTATPPAGATATPTPTSTVLGEVLGEVQGPQALPDTGAAPAGGSRSYFPLLLALGGLALLGGAGTLATAAARRRR